MFVQKKISMNFFWSKFFFGGGGSPRIKVAQYRGAKDSLWLCSECVVYCCYCYRLLLWRLSNTECLSGRRWLLWCLSNTECLSGGKWSLYTVAFDGLDLGVRHSECSETHFGFRIIGIQRNLENFTCGHNHRHATMTRKRRRH